MRIVFLVAGAAILAGIVVSPVVNRVRPGYSDAVRLVRFLLAYVVFALALAWVAVGLAQKGGPLFVGLAVVSALLAVVVVALGAVVVWAFARREEVADE